MSGGGGPRESAYDRGRAPIVTYPAAVAGQPDRSPMEDEKPSGVRNTTRDRRDTEHFAGVGIRIVAVLIDVVITVAIILPVTLAVDPVVAATVVSAGYWILSVAMTVQFGGEPVATAAVRTGFVATLDLAGTPDRFYPLETTAGTSEVDAIAVGLDAVVIGGETKPVGSPDHRSGRGDHAT